MFTTYHVPNLRRMLLTLESFTRISAAVPHNRSAARMRPVEIGHVVDTAVDYEPEVVFRAVFRDLLRRIFRQLRSCIIIIIIIEISDVEVVYL